MGTHWRQLQGEALAELVTDNRRKHLTPATPGQTAYLRSLEENDITLCTGPAGSGKTFLACGVAARLLAEEKVKKVLFSRPLVPCGQGVGFLPGELKEKVCPYMRPILDALSEFMTTGELSRHMADGRIEMVPPDLLRGASLPDTMLVLDEAQNVLYSQARMFITRLGKGSRVVLLGDASQSDITHPGPNPFLEVILRLRRVQGVGVVRLTRKDIVRHPRLRAIEEALDDTSLYDGADPTHEAWYDFSCPKCRARVWYGNGDESDLNRPDVELVRCWHCSVVNHAPEYDGQQARLARGEQGAVRGQRRPG